MSEDGGVGRPCQGESLEQGEKGMDTCRKVMVLMEWDFPTLDGMTFLGSTRICNAPCKAECFCL